MDQALFIANNVLAAAVAAAAARVAMKGRPPWAQAVAALATFPVVVLAACLALGMAGHLAAGPAAAVMGVLALGAGAAWWRWGRHAGAPAPADILPQPLEPGERLKLSIALGLLAGFGGVLVLQACLTGTNYHWDDLTYHAPAAAHWLVNGRLSVTPLNHHAYYPLNAEVMSLWFMLPFHADAYASLSGLYWAVLAAASCIALVLKLGRSRPAALFCGAVLLACPVLLGSVKTFAAVDLAGPAMLLAALALALPSAGETPRMRLADATYCGLLAGYAAGCKISFVPPCILLLLWQVFRRLGEGGVSRRAKAAGAFILAAGLSGAFWYVRNWVLTGNPAFPARVGAFDGPFGPEEQWRTKLISWILAAPANPGQWAKIAQWYTAWPFGLFLLAMAGYGVGVGAQIRRRGTHTPESATRFVLLVVGLTMAALYPFTPFSGTIDSPTGELIGDARYVIAPFCIGIVLFSSLLEGLGPSHLWWAMGVLAAATAWPEANNNPAVVMAVISAGDALLLAGRLRRLAAEGWRRQAALAAVLLAGLALLAWWAPRKQAATDAKLYEYRYSENRGPVTKGWRALEDLPEASRVAWFGVGDYEYYPLFGRRLNLVPVKVLGDGTLHEPLHERWRRDPQGTRWWERDRPCDAAALLPNLRKARVEYVLVTRNEDRWPPQDAALASSTQARKVFDDAYSVIWKLDGGAAK